MPPTDTPDELLRTHGDEVMASALRWAETPEDAEDAYQRGMEIMLTKAPTTDPGHLVPWLKTVVKREAWAIRRQRERQAPPAGEYEDLDSPGPLTAHDHAERREQISRGAEALARLKPNEVRAMLLKAEGLSYREICAETGWTYTKVNRCLAEGRRRFQDRLAGIESGAECARLEPALSRLADGEADAADVTLLRPHLRTCLTCRARLREYRTVPAQVAAAAPPVAAGGALAAWLRELLNGGGAWVSERSAALAVRWHQAAELATAHKAAAVVASAAVLASGGAATVATVDGGPRPTAVRSAPGSSITPTTAPAPNGNKSAEPRNATASKGDARERGAPRDGTASTGRTSTSASTPADEPNGSAPAAGEFTPDPAPAERAAAPRPERPGRAAGSVPEGGGEFSP